MKRKEKAGRKVFMVVNVIVLALIGYCCLAPMLHVLWCSISDPLILSREKSFLFFPKGEWTFDGYVAILGYGNVLIGYANTLFYVVIGTAINLVLTTISAFLFSRKRFLLANPIMLFISFTMLFNGGMIPNYLLVLNLGLFDSRLALLLPGALNVFNLVIMRTSFMQIPESLEESARLDGANDLQVLTRIIIPVSKATIAVVTLFVAVGIWNSWFSASIYLTDRTKYPLQLFLREILINNSQRNIESGIKTSVMAQQTLLKYCTIIVATLPILCIYPFVQKYFVKGVMVGSIKG